MKKKLSVILLFMACSMALNAQPTDNVVAYYPFNGNANDVTSNGKNANILGATPTAERLGKANAAYSFNGIGNMMYLPNNLLPGNSALCVSFWFKSFGPGYFNGQTMVDFRGQYNFSVSVFTNHPTIQQAVLFNIAAPSPSLNCLTPNNSIQYGTWYHVVANYGGGVMSLYLNGVLADSKAQLPPNAVSGYNNTIGKDYHGDGDNRAWFYGAIDEVVIYKRNLTSSEVQALYNRGLTSSEIPELYWHQPVNYGYDAAGRRNSRNNTITLKSANYITVRDSVVHVKSMSPEGSFQETLGEQKIVIYPNPTKGQLKVEISEFDPSQKPVIYIYNPLGTLIIKKLPATGSEIIDLSSYNNGIYIMRIQLADKTSDWKIVKE